MCILLSARAMLPPATLYYINISFIFLQYFKGSYYILFPASRLSLMLILVATI